jgi:hypothetical protein
VAALNERLAAVTSELSSAQAMNQRDSDRIAELQEDYNALLKRSPGGGGNSGEANPQYAAQIEDLVAERDATRQQVVINHLYESFLHEGVFVSMLIWVRLHVFFWDHT